MPQAYGILNAIKDKDKEKNTVPYGIINAQGGSTEEPEEPTKEQQQTTNSTLPEEPKNNIFGGMSDDELRSYIKDNKFKTVGSFLSGIANNIYEAVSPSIDKIRGVAGAPEDTEKKEKIEKRAQENKELTANYNQAVSEMNSRDYDRIVTEAKADPKFMDYYEKYGDTGLIKLPGLDDTENAILSYLHRNADEEGYEQFYSLVESKVNKARTEKVTDFGEGLADKIGTVPAHLTTIPTRMVSGFGLVEDIARIAAGKGIDQNSFGNMFSNYTTATRRGVEQYYADKYPAEILGHNVAGFIYQTTSSIVDNVAQIALGSFLASGFVATEGLTAVQAFQKCAKASEGFVLTVMSTGAAADTAIEMKNKGYDDMQIAATAIMAGVAEYVSEKIGFDNLVADNITTGSLREMIKFWIGQSMAEGSEEVVSDLINNICDVIINGDKSELKLAVENYMASGYSEDVAYGLAIRDQFIESGFSFAGGFLSGAIMGGGKVIGTASSFELQGTKIKNDIREATGNEWNADNTFNLIAEGKAVGGISQELASQIESRVKDDGTISNYDVGRLAQNIELANPSFQATTSESKKATEENTKKENATQGKFEASSDVMESNDILTKYADAIGLGENGKKNLLEFKQQSNDSNIYEYAKNYMAYYNAGKEGIDVSDVDIKLAGKSVLNNIQSRAAYSAGIIDNNKARSTQNEGTNDRSSGSEWNVGNNSSKPIRILEGDSGKIETRSELRINRAAKDEGAHSAEIEEQLKSGKDFGIGTDELKVGIVKKSSYSKSMIEADDLASKYGYEIVFYVGNNISMKNGTARGAFDGKKIYVRADHPRYTALQIAKHELGHTSVRYGGVVVDTIVKSVRKTGIDVDQAIDIYLIALANKGLTEDQVIEEMYCDAMGEMNIFGEGTYQEYVLKPVQKAIRNATKNATKNATDNATNDATKNTSIRYSIDQNFEAKYDAWDKKKGGFNFRIGTTSEALKSIGFKDTTVTWSASKILKVKKDHPEMSDNVIKQVPNVCENPIIIMDSKTVSGRFVVVGDVYAENGRPVVVAIGIDTSKESGNEIDLIYIASAYTKEKLQSMLNSSNIRYVDKNKNRVNTWLTINRLQLPLVNTSTNSSAVSLPQKNTVVNTKGGKNNNSYSTEIDSEYMELAKDPVKNESKLRDMVEDAAKKAGYNQKLYHGSNRFGFTAFDLNEMDDRRSIFATDSVEVASTYVSRDYFGDPKSDRIKRDNVITPEELNKLTPDQLLDVINNGLYGTDYNEGKSVYKIDDFDYEKAANEAEEAFIKIADTAGSEEAKDIIRQIKLAENEEEAFDLFNEYRELAWKSVRDAGYDYSDIWNKYYEFVSRFEGTHFRLVSTEGGALLTITEKRVKDRIANAVFGGIYELYGKTENMLEIDADDSYWDSIEGSTINRRGLVTTREVSEYAMEHNYNGVVIRNVLDNGNSSYTDSDPEASDVYIYFNPTSLKSADPVTYDDSGNVIPLSERFNAGNQDLRYSSELDSEGSSLSEGQLEFFKDSVIRDKKGNLLKVYHGTDAEFYEFSYDKANKHGHSKGFGFYLTPNEEMARHYGSRIIEAYANVTKPLSGKKKTVTQTELKRFVTALVDNDLQQYKSDGLTWQDSFISNYIYTYERGMTKSSAISQFVSQILASNDNDNDIIYEIANASGNNYNAEGAKKFYRVLTDSIGYDGAWYGDEIVVFDSSQIKEVTNLNPTESEDIRYSMESFGWMMGFETDIERAEMAERSWYKKSKKGEFTYVENVTPELLSGTPIDNFLHIMSREMTKRGIPVSNTYIQDRIKFVSDFANLILKYRNLRMIYEIAGANAFTAIKANSDTQYGWSIDFASICKKTEAIMNAISDRMLQKLKGNVPGSRIAVTKEEILQIYREQVDMGKLAPCPYCYVFSRWLGVGSRLQRMWDYQEKYKNYTKKQIDDAINKASDVVTQYRNSLDKEITFGKARSELVQKAQRANDKIEALLNEYTYDNAPPIIKKRVDEIVELSPAKTYEELQYMSESLDEYTWMVNVRSKDDYEPVPGEILFNLTSAPEFATKYPRAWSWRKSGGSAGGKSITPYSSAWLGDLFRGVVTPDEQKQFNKAGDVMNPFVHNVLNKTVSGIMDKAFMRQKAQNLIGGTRVQSWSDTKESFITDWFIEVLNLESLNAKAQGYSKVIECVDMWGSVGASINLSLAGEGKGYVTRNGKNEIVTSNMTGIELDSAVEMMKKYPTIGTIIIGTSDVQIDLCFNSREVRMIIPYHASGNTDEVLAQMMNAVDLAYSELPANEHHKDYSLYQRDIKVNDDILASDTYYAKDGGPGFDLTAIKEYIAKYGMARVKANRSAREKLLRGKSLNEAEKAAVANSYYLQNIQRILNTDEFRGATLSEKQAEQVYPFEFWDTNTTYDTSSINSKRFIEYTTELGLIPRFYQFSDRDFYWKTLVDRNMYDYTTGEYVEQPHISPEQLFTDLESGDHPLVNIQNGQVRTLGSRFKGHTQEYYAMQYAKSRAKNNYSYEIDTTFREDKVTKQTNQLNKEYNQYKADIRYYGTVLSGPSITKVANMLANDYKLDSKNPAVRQKLKHLADMITTGKHTFSKIKDESYELARDLVYGSLNVNADGLSAAELDNVVKGYDAATFNLIDMCSNDILLSLISESVTQSKIDKNVAMAEIRGAYDKKTLERKIEKLNQNKENLLKEIDESKLSKAEALKKARESKQRAIADLKNHYKEVQFAKQWRAAESQARRNLLAIVKRLQNKKVTRANRAMLDELIGDIDSISMSLTNKSIKRLSDLRDWYEEQKKDPDFIPDDNIEKAIDRLSKHHISELDIQDIVQLTQILLGIEHEINTRNKMIGINDARTVYEMGKATIDDIKSAKGFSSSFERVLLMGTLRPDTFFKTIVGYNTDSPLYMAFEELNAGQRTTIEYQMRAFSMFNKFTQDKEFIESLTGKKAKDITFYQGMYEYHITPAMRISLYLHRLNDDNMRHIVRGGIVLPGNMEAYRKGDKKKAFENTTTVVLKPSEVDEILAGMTEKEKQFAHAIRMYFINMSQPLINETSEKLKGYSLAEVEEYFPINVDQDFLKTDFSAMKVDGTLEGSGFLKDRIKSGKPVYLLDVTDVLERSIIDTSRYVGMAIPIRDINRLITSSDSVTENAIEGELADRVAFSVMKEIKSKFGNEGMNYISGLLGDLQSRTTNPNNVFGDVFKLIKSNYANAVLTLNPGVAIKQTSSLPSAAAIIGWSPIAKALRSGDKTDAHFIGWYSPLLWYRSQGYSTQELGDISKKQNMLTKALSHKALNWIQGMDVMTVKLLWTACTYYVEENTELKRGSNEFYAEVGVVFNRVVEETQPNYTTLQRPAILRSDNKVVQALNMFKTQPFQNFNVLYDAVRTYQHAKQVFVTTGDSNALVKAKKGLANAITSQLVASIMFSAMGALWKLIRGKYNEDDEFDFVQLLKDLGFGMLSNGFGMFPYGSMLLDTIEFTYDTVAKNMDMDAFFNAREPEASVAYVETLLNTMNNIARTFGDIAGTISGKKDINDIFNRVKADAYSIGQLLGVPAQNVGNMLEAILFWIKKVLSNL